MTETSKLTAVIDRKLFARLKAALAIKGKTIQEWVESLAKKEVGEK